MTTRRNMLVGAGVLGGGALASTLAKPAIAQSSPEIRWRLASSYPKSLDTVFGASELVSQMVSKATGGKFTIQVFAAGEIVPAFQVFDAVSNGTVQCGHTASFFYWGKEPALAFDYTIPFGLNARQHNAWYLYGGGRQQIQDVLNPYGITSYACGNFGGQMGGWFRNEIKTPEDFRGLKMRIGGFAGAMLAKVGGVPQNIPAGDIYPALERGTIDACEWVGPYDDEKLGFYRIAKNYYYPGWQEGSGQISLYVNSKALSELPGDYRAALEQACLAAHVLTQAKYDHLNPIALRDLVAKGAALRAFPKPVLDRLFAATNEVLDEQAAKNAHFKKILDSWRPYQREISSWFVIGEQYFDSYVAQALRNSAR